jgi:hypothetical protein
LQEFFRFEASPFCATRSMPDLTTWAIPASLAVLFAETITGENAGH